MQPSLLFLKDLAYQAGEILRRGYGQRHTIQMKGVTDLVTEIDHQSEKLILDAIHTRFPDHHIFSEEHGQMVGDPDHCWYIDPLDGTVNYAHEIPLFCVSIAYAEAGEVKYGVIYEPLRDECFSAEYGRGAWLNKELIHVSNSTTLISSLLATGFPYHMLNTPLDNLDNFSYFSTRTRGVRRLGSAAVDMAYVACGRIDGFWEVTLKNHDIAAGGLIVREAGGIATNIHGSPNFLKDPISILAANPHIHPLIMEGLMDGV